MFNTFVLITFLVSALLLALTLVQRESPPDALPGESSGEAIATFAVLEVGHALSAAVVTEDGRSLVYDFGGSREGAEDVIIPFLDDRDVQRLDYAILSHPHQDHLGGLPALLEGTEVDTYLDPVIETSNQTYEHSLEIIEDRRIATGVARQGDSYTLGEHVEVEILWPPEELLTESDGDPLVNENSTVVRVTAGDVNLLLTGDIGEETEHLLAETYGDQLEADILQIPHHGSNTSTSDAFLRHVEPDVGIITVGSANQYGHPHSEVVERLRSHGIEIYRSDVDGTVIIATDGDHYELDTRRTGLSWTIPALPRHLTASSMISAATHSRSWFWTTASN